MLSSFRAAVRLSLAAAAVASAQPLSAQVAPPAGYIYGAQRLASPTQGCVANGPGGTFVGVGPGFTPNAQAVVLARESGDARLVAFGFSSIGGCVYDRATDTLYVSDNAAGGDFSLSPALVPSGDTIYAVAQASTAAALLATDVEMLPPGSIAFAGSVALHASGDLLVGNAVGSGAGTVLRVDSGLQVSTFASGFDFTGGIAVDPQTGDVFVGEFLSSFQNQITRLSAAGSPIAAPLLAPSFAFGSAGLALFPDGSLLATGVFAGDVVVIDPSSPTTSTFAAGLTYATGAAVDPFTGRVSLLSSTFAGADEDRSLHRFTPIDRLTPGTGSARSECLQELYGIELVAAAPGRKPTKATCVDGAACDADGLANGACLFPVGSCLNVLDPRFFECDRSADIVSFSATARPESAAIRALESKVTATLPLPGNTPACFFSDGVVVPLRRSGAGAPKSGKAKVTVTVQTAAGKSDRDSFGLVCLPAAP